MDAMCCDVIVGIYCEAGETCTTQNTCCVDGLNCNTDVPVGVECSSDETECGVGKSSPSRPFLCFESCIC
jgi:hypothetical protein